MMRLARRATLLVALFLLTTAATAYAECAWVLWESTASTKAQTTIEPVRGYTTKRECDTALAAALDAYTGTLGFIRKDTKYQEAYVKMGDATLSYAYRCLPDTVDPRGPKGK
jgi:hypothetical protein